MKERPKHHPTTFSCQLVDLTLLLLYYWVMHTPMVVKLSGKAPVVKDDGSSAHSVLSQNSTARNNGHSNKHGRLSPS